MAGPSAASGRGDPGAADTPPQPRLAESVRAAGLGTFDYDLRTGLLDWDQQLVSMLGFDGDERFDRSVEAFGRRIHPDDLELITAAMADAASRRDTLNAVCRLVLPGGRLRWLQVRGRAIPGPDGTAERLIGVVFDITDAWAKQQQAEQVLESMSVGFIRLDADWTVSYANAEAERLTRQDRSAMVGANLWELFAAARGEPFEPVYRRVAATRVSETVEGYYPEPANAWFEVRVVPEPGGGVSQYFLDVSERRAAQRLLQLSVEVGQRLVGAADVSEAATAMARAVVPLLADWSIVSLVEADGRVRDVRGVHRNPARQEVVQRFMDYRGVGGGTGIVEGVVASHRPRLIAGQDWLSAARQRGVPEAAAALRELDPAAVAVFPLHSGPRTNGVLILGREPRRPPLTEQEYDLLATICRRAGLAIDNARLNEDLAAAAEHDRSVATELQQALLTDLPQPDDLQLVARYLTAVDPDQVGGDWTDALIQTGGATTVMVGDVVGHDIRAAATMGQLRGMLRTFAWLDAAPPSQLLAQLDRAARDMGIVTTATALVARIEQSPEQLASGVRLVRWSSAGHPPPIVLHPDGRTEILEPVGGNDVLLGVAPDRDRHDQTWTAEPGSTLLLYTDGLIETRDETIDAGLQRLRDALTRHRELDLDDLVDAVLADLIGERRDDDTALLAIRFHPQRPVPPAA